MPGVTELPSEVDRIRNRIKTWQFELKYGQAIYDTDRNKARRHKITKSWLYVLEGRIYGLEYALLIIEKDRY